MQTRVPYVGRVEIEGLEIEGGGGRSSFTPEILASHQTPITGGKLLPKQEEEEEHKSTQFYFIFSLIKSTTKKALQYFI